MKIDGVKIYTMDDSMTVIENGHVIINGGKIESIGEGGLDGCDVIHESGVMLPGLIDAHTHLGIVEDSLTFEGEDDNEVTDPVTPQLRTIDAINPFDRCFTDAVAAGVTCCAVAPGSANPIGGQICVIKTVGKRVDSMIINPYCAMKIALGENPKSAYHEKNQAPETRMSTAAIIREALRRAKEYAEDYDKYNEAIKKGGEDAEDAERPDFDAKSEALIELVRKRAYAHFHAHRSDDIFTAVRIAEEFSLKYQIVHATEGYLIADELKSTGAGVFAGPNLCDRCKPELKNQTFMNPGALDRAGIMTAITTDHPVTPINYLTLCAAMAHKAGMSKTSAYRAITSNPAKLLGIYDRVGSIEPGKDADLVIFDGDMLDMFTSVKRVFVDGREVEISKQNGHCNG